MHYIPFIVFIGFSLISLYFQRKAGRYVKEDYKKGALSFITKYPIYYRSEAYVNKKGIKYKNLSMIIGISGFIVASILFSIML